MHSDMGEDATVLLNGVTCTLSSFPNVTDTNNGIIFNEKWDSTCPHKNLTLPIGEQDPYNSLQLGSPKGSLIGSAIFQSI